MTAWNPRINKKEIGLIKGALRRVFSRSEMRKQAIDATVVSKESVPIDIRAMRPRVLTWHRCPDCLQFCNRGEMDCDHIDPIIPLNSSLEQVDVRTLVDRIWCEPTNLRGTCKECHREKTSSETKIRAKHRRDAKAVDATHQISQAQNTKTRRVKR